MRPQGERMSGDRDGQGYENINWIDDVRLHVCAAPGKCHICFRALILLPPQWRSITSTGKWNSLAPLSSGTNVNTLHVIHTLPFDNVLLDSSRAAMRRISTLINGPRARVLLISPAAKPWGKVRHLLKDAVASFSSSKQQLVLWTSRGKEPCGVRRGAAYCKAAEST